MAIRPEQKLVELVKEDLISIVRRCQGRTRPQRPPSDGHTYPKDTPRPSLLFHVHKRILLPAHSQTWVAVRTALAGTAALQPYAPLYDEKSILAVNGVACVKPNVPFQMLIANTES